MNQLKKAGFFRELRHGLVDGPSLRESIPKSGAMTAAPLVAYLKNAPILFATPGVVEDVLAPGKEIGPPHIRTDGVWCWPSDLAYYVEQYACPIPEDFAAYIKAHNYRPPLDDEVDFEKIQF